MSNFLYKNDLPDNLDLGNAGLTNVWSVNATDVTINGVSFNNPFSGDYSDLTNKPIIPVVPSAISAFATTQDT